MKTFKIPFEVFKREIMREGWLALECSFCVDNHPEYDYCWLGKMAKSETEIYWFGLAEDGSQAYDFPTFDEFVNAKIFQNRSLYDVWSLVSFYCFNNCDVDEWFNLYSSGKAGDLDGWRSGAEG